MADNDWTIDLRALIAADRAFPPLERLRLPPPCKCCNGARPEGHRGGRRVGAGRKLNWRMRR